MSKIVPGICSWKQANRTLGRVEGVDIKVAQASEAGLRAAPKIVARCQYSTREQNCIENDENGHVPEIRASKAHAVLRKVDLLERDLRLHFSRVVLLTALSTILRQWFGSVGGVT